LKLKIFPYLQAIKNAIPIYIPNAQSMHTFIEDNFWRAIHITQLNEKGALNSNASIPYEVILGHLEKENCLNKDPKKVNLNCLYNLMNHFV
jgi:hypothetical protein